MELFQNAKAVRLKSVHNKYLTAEEDEESVTQDRNGSSKSAKWVVEFSEYEGNIIRLKSCYNKYLTASNQPFLLGMTGRKVIQSDPGLSLGRVDSSAEWEPIKDGNNQVKLRTRYGQFLRANGGLPPWRNSVTHDIPHRTSTQDWVVWDVDVVEIVVKSPLVKLDAAAPVPVDGRKESFDSDYKSVSSDHSVKSESFTQLEFDDAIDNSPPKIKSGRIIYYKIGDETGESEEIEGPFITFKGNSVEELTKILQEETGLEDIVLCTKSPVNGRLYPLRLQLPPNNAAMHVVVAPSSPKVARILTMSLRALYDTLRIVCCMLLHQLLCSLFHFLIIFLICTLHK